MTALRVCVTLCSLLTLSHAAPVNSSDSHPSGRCNFLKEHMGQGFILECDSDGNYLPQQCCASTGYCWCVNIFTGQEIVHTRGALDDYHYDCVKKHYCPYDWTQVGSRCFMFFDSQKTWTEAENYCIFEGANLASVHSDEEYYTVQSLTRGGTYNFPLTWLGAHDAVLDSFWMWNDGSKFGYTNWHMDYKSAKAGRCLLMNYEWVWKWHSAACNTTLPFVCSKSAYYYTYL